MVGSKKKGFTLVELIFAIVVLSIVVISIPVIAKINVSNMQRALVQEAIFATSSKLANITGYYFDKNSMADANITAVERVVNIGSDCNASTHLRPGHINQPLHRRCINDSSITSLSKAQDLVYPTIENAIDSGDLFTGAGSKSGYKSSYEYELSTDYSNNDVKKITATIKLEDKDVVVLKTFVANIGEPEFYKRSF